MAASPIYGLLILYSIVVAFLLPTATMSAGSPNSGFSIRMIPIDSPELPFFPKNLAPEERLARLREISVNRAQYLGSIVSSATPANSSGEVRINEISPRLYHTVNNYYAVQVGIGRPPFSTYLSLDTGSSLTWVQGEGYNSGFPVQGGSFPYRRSSTYRYIRPTDHRCFTGLAHGQACMYDINYIGCSSSGVLSTETFTFGRGDDQVAHEMIFGCSFNSRFAFGGAHGHHNVIAGVFGLGYARESILIQLQARTDARFSYCLRPPSAPNATATYLRFGSDAEISPGYRRRVHATAMQQHPSGHYHIRVESISVDGYVLPLAPDLFFLKSDGTGGFVIDSGAPISLLVEPAYLELHRTMRRYFRRSCGLAPLTGNQTFHERTYQLCFHLPPGGRCDLPSMRIHLSDAEIMLPHQNVFQWFGNDFCLLFNYIDEPMPSILGAFQQVNFRYWFDVRAGRVSFIAENCQ